MAPVRVALVGDFQAGITAHRAIEACCTLAQRAGRPFEATWRATSRLTPKDAALLEPFDGVWCVPGSPYDSTAGALWAIQYARTRSLPFLGTCGGFQHAVLEYARNVLGLNEAGHAELDAGTGLPLIHQMQCRLVERSQRITTTNHKAFISAYGGREGEEAFHCSYGLNPQFEHLFANTAMEIAARSDDGEVRAVALRGHPFFIGTLFQPERRALTGALHPLVGTFFGAAAAHTRKR